MSNLYESLVRYSGRGIYPMHMPGHKRNGQFRMVNPYSFDVTEVEGTDDLYHPQGLIKASMEYIAKMCGSEKSFLLVNGSTCGILAAISACCRRGQKILMSRNCHKSVYHAVFLLDLEPVYLHPASIEESRIADGITKKDVEEALKGAPDVKCVMITSPTYEGIVSHINEISRFLHERKIPLIVDEAHGAHFLYHPGFPQPAVNAGADMVIQSIHKTLPSLTQTAILHYRSGLADETELKRFLGIYQTSSPSYVLMSSMDQCYHWLQEQGEEAFSDFMKRLGCFYERMKSLKCLKLLEKDREKKDCSKLVILTGGGPITGPQLAAKLRIEYQIETEMALSDYVIAMTSVADSEQGFFRLGQALLEIDAGLFQEEDPEISCGQVWTRPEICFRPYDAIYCEGERVPLLQAEGGISKEYLYIYPPGIPLVVPGERLSRELIAYIDIQRESGCELRGLKDESGTYIEVIRGSLRLGL